MNLKNLLIPFQIQDPQSEEIFFRNAGKARNRGVELNLSWWPFPALQASLAYSAVDFEFRDYPVDASDNGHTIMVQLAGNEVPGVPPQHLVVGLALELAFGGYVEGNAQWWDDYFTNDFNGPPVGAGLSKQEFVNDAYTLVDVRLGVRRQIGSLAGDLFLGVNNVLDKRYNGSIVPNAFGNRFFETAPGRFGTVGMALVFSE